MSIFVVVYTHAGETVVTEEDRRAHLRFLQQLVDARIVLISGPFDDEAKGGMQVVRAQGPEHARELFARDPYVLRGIVARVEVRSWRPTLGELAACLPGLNPPAEARNDTSGSSNAEEPARPPH